MYNEFERARIVFTSRTFLPNIVTAITQKKVIVWRCFLRFRMTITLEIISNYYIGNKQLNDFSAETRGSNLMYENWTYLIRLWNMKLRMRRVHACGTTINTEARTKICLKN